MNFYMIAHCRAGMEYKVYAGQSKLEVVRNARELIDNWSEYKELSNEDIIDLAEVEGMKFDLVEVPESYPSDDSEDNLKYIYRKHFGI